MLAKLLLLIIYFLIVFLVARILDVSSAWLEAGCLATHFFDPFTLSVRKLKAILERRGVSYTGVVEKNELVDLVEASGAVIEPDLSSQDQVDNEEDGEKFEFTGASHFFEEVEDTKAGSWLVEVIPQGHRPSLTPQQWKSLKRKIAWFGIRIGTFRCENDPWLCHKYRWKKSAIFLSMPQSNQPKGNVIFQTYDSTSRPNVDNVYRWVNSRLSTKVQEISDLNQFRLRLKSELDQNYIYVVLFSTLPEPPMYLTSLSIKFTGRVRFAYYRSLAKQPRYSKELREFKIERLPTLMLFTPEKEFVFGLRKGEQIDYKTMDLFLKTLHPEVNDLFLGALIAVNLSCILEVFIMKGGILRRTFQLMCLLTFYNTSLILLSLPVIGLFQLPGLTPVLNTALKLCRSIMTTDMAAVLRNDFLLCTKYKCITMIGYLMFGVLVGWMRKKWKHYFGADDDTDTDPNTDWLTQDLNYFSQLAQSFSYRNPQINYASTSFEDGFEMLVRRLAVPDLWLQPVFPTDYIQQLPTWSFCCKNDINVTDEKNGHDTRCNQLANKPPIMIMCNECAICLEAFVYGATVLGLPCGHSFHQQCICMWLTSGTTMAHHCCPSCRWPAYMSKPMHSIPCQDQQALIDNNTDNN